MRRANAGLLDEVIEYASVTLGGGAQLLPRRLEELGRNGELACARYTVLRPLS